MRRIVITVVSLLAVLMHTQVGCCAHHAHAQPASEAELGHHGLAHHDHCDGSHQHLPPSPIDPLSHDDCHETHCDTTLVSQVQAPTPPAYGYWAPFCSLAHEQSADQAAEMSADRPSDPTGAPPLRAHLRFTVLLI